MECNIYKNYGNMQNKIFQSIINNFYNQKEYNLLLEMEEKDTPKEVYMIEYMLVLVILLAS